MEIFVENRVELVDAGDGAMIDGATRQLSDRAVQRPNGANRRQAKLKSIGKRWLIFENTIIRFDGVPWNRRRHCNARQFVENIYSNKMIFTRTNKQTANTCELVARVLLDRVDDRRRRRRRR